MVPWQACCFSGKQFSPRVVELRIVGHGSSLTYKQTNTKSLNFVFEQDHFKQRAEQFVVMAIKEWIFLGVI